MFLGRISTVVLPSPSTSTGPLDSKDIRTSLQPDWSAFRSRKNYFVVLIGSKHTCFEIELFEQRALLRIREDRSTPIKACP